MKRLKKENERYIPRVYTYEVMKGKTLPKKTTIQKKYQDGTRIKERYFKRSGKVIHQKVYYKFFNSKKKDEFKLDEKTGKVVKYDFEISYDKFIKKTLKQINRRKGKIDVSFGVQKFVGKVYKPSKAGIIGNVSKMESIQSMKKKRGKKVDIINFMTRVDDAKENLERKVMYMYDKRRGKVVKLKKVKGKFVEVRYKRKSKKK